MGNPPGLLPNKFGYQKLASDDLRVRCRAGRRPHEDRAHRIGHGRLATQGFFPELRGSREALEIAPEVLTQTELCRACARQVNEELRSSRPTNMVKTLRRVGFVTLPGAVWRVPTGLPHWIQRRRSFEPLRGGWRRRSASGGSWWRRRRDDHVGHEQRRRSARHASGQHRTPLCSRLHLILSVS